MNITVAQIFQIGSVLITLVGVLLGFFYDPKIVSTVSAAVLTAWNAIGAILTGQQSQAQSVAKHIDDPGVKATIVPAVANLEGVEHVRINDKADPTLKQLAEAAGWPKVLPPK